MNHWSWEWEICYNVCRNNVLNPGVHKYDKSRSHVKNLGAARVT